MSLEPLNNLCQSFSPIPWQRSQQLQYLKVLWPSLVGPIVAQHSRPLDLQRGVLQIATSTNAWSQNLSFERLQILSKIQQCPDLRGLEIRDLRFSTAQWQSQPLPSPQLDSSQQQHFWQNHPSRLPSQPPTPTPEPRSPQAAFQGWSHRRQKQLQHLPTCPRCQRPTPPGELQRWRCCAFCLRQP